MPSFNRPHRPDAAARAVAFTEDELNELRRQIAASIDAASLDRLEARVAAAARISALTHDHAASLNRAISRQRDAGGRTNAAGSVE